MVSCKDSVDLLRFKIWHLLLGLQEISPKSYRKPTNDPDVLKSLWKAPSCKMGYKTNNIPTPKFSGKLLSSFWEGSPGPMYPARKITVARVLQARRTAWEALASYVEPMGQRDVVWCKHMAYPRENHLQKFNKRIQMVGFHICMTLQEGTPAIILGSNGNIMIKGIATGDTIGIANNML